jgi:repressor LexA
MEQLTNKQKRVLDYIEKFLSDNSYPPTYQEIAKKFNFAIGTVQDYVSALIRKGYLERKKDLSRGFKLLKNSVGKQNLKNRIEYDIIPLYGAVAAGEPIFANDNIEGYISIERNKKGHHLHFALKVKGDSMRDAGIFDGDIVIVKKQDSAEDGDVIIALIEDEATVKTLRNSKIRAFLEASNPKYKSIVNKPFTVIGKVIELRRKYQIF